MKKPFLLILILILLIPSSGHAFWVWTPETNKWVNPKYSVKDTPSEQLRYGLDFYNAKEYPEGIREFQKLIKHYPRAREAPEAQYYIGKSYQDQDNIFEAFKQYQVVVEKYPFSERSAEIVKIQYEIGETLLEGNHKKGKLMGVLGGGDYDVVEVFRTVIKNAPYGSYAAPAQYKIGLYLMEKQLFVEARDEFEKVISDYPDSQWAKAAQYQIALTDAKRSTDAQYDQKITQAAVEEFKEFLGNNPDAELSHDAKKQINELREKEAENNFLVAAFYEKQKNYESAKIYYKIIVDDYSSTTWATKALVKYREMNIKTP